MNDGYPAVFLDRDGVICKEKSYITSADQVEIYPFAYVAVKKIKDAGLKTIVVTNQSAVGRGMIDEKELCIINQKLKNELMLDDIYYCPHLPPERDTIPPYRIVCECRKPEPGMLLKAASDYNIDLENSYMVGDRASDILAGKRAGVRTVLLKTGYGEKGLEFYVEPDYVFPHLGDFADFILENYKNI